MCTGAVQGFTGHVEAYGYLYRLEIRHRTAGEFMEKYNQLRKALSPAHIVSKQEQPSGAANVVRPPAMTASHLAPDEWPEFTTRAPNRNIQMQMLVKALQRTDLKKPPETYEGQLASSICQTSRSYLAYKLMSRVTV